MIRTLKSYSRSTLGRTFLCFIGVYCLERHIPYLSLSGVLCSSNLAFERQSNNNPERNMADSGDVESAAENNGLVLYYHHHSFYAQKVLMALYEKKLPFSSKLVDITKGEQYQPWFLKINPKGEVPVLKDGIKFIPDSVRIIDYLEDNFSNGEQSRLLPIDQGPEVRQKIVHFRTEIDKIPANVLTLGTFFNSELCSNLKYPFSLSAVRNHLKASEVKSSESLREVAEKNPESRDMLLQKASAQDKKHLIVTNKDKFVELLDQVGAVLDQVEKELASHSNDNFWLCTDRFTVADISLTILLDRISRIGLENYFWNKTLRPHIGSYYQRVQLTDAYKNSVPTPMTDVKIFLATKAPILFGVSIVAVIALIVGGYFWVKRH